MSGVAGHAAEPAARTKTGVRQRFSRLPSRFATARPAAPARQVSSGTGGSRPDGER